MLPYQSPPFIEWFRQPINRLVTLLAMIPVALIFFYVVNNVVSIPVNDHWASVDIAVKTKTDQLEFSDLIRQHNEHRIFFTNALTATLTKLNDWDLRYEAYASLALAFANLLLIIHLFYMDEPQGLPLVIIPFAALVFSFRQYMNWLSGFLNCWHFCIFFLLLSLYVLKRGTVGWRSIILAAFFAFCSMYSLGSGLSVWVLLVPTLWMLCYRKWYYGLFWIGVASLSYYLYFTDYKFNNDATTYDIPILFKFTTAYLGNSFVSAELAHRATASWIGGLGLGLFLFNIIYLKKAGYTWETMAIWLTLGLFAIGTAGVTSITQSQEGLALALAGRYVTLAMLFWISVVALGGMTVTHIWQTQKHKYLLNLHMLCLVILAGYYVSANYRSANYPLLVTPEDKACLVAYPVTRDMACLKGLYPRFGNYQSPQQKGLLRKADQLAEYKLAIFAYTEPGSIMLPYHYSAQARLAIEAERPRRALTLYNTGLKLYPDNANLYTLRGLLYLDLGNGTKAFNNFSKALALNPIDMVALRERGLIFMQQGLYPEARGDFNLMLNIDPTNTFAQEQLKIIDELQRP